MAMNFPSWSCVLCLKGHFCFHRDIVTGVNRETGVNMVSALGEVFGGKEWHEQERSIKETAQWKGRSECLGG